MKANIDWFFLRQPLIFLAVALLTCFALVYAGMQYESMKNDDYRQHENSLRSTYNLYTNMVNDIDLLEQYTARYNEYKSSGLVGAERRLSWIESLEATNSVLQLPRLTYRLNPQEDFVREGLNPGRGVKINSSPMELEMALLHEEDLFALLEGLELSVSNLFTVDYCSIVRLGNVEGSFDTKTANLDARCTIRWISIDAK